MPLRVWVCCRALLEAHSVHCWSGLEVKGAFNIWIREHSEDCRQKASVTHSLLHWQWHSVGNAWSRWVSTLIIHKVPLVKHNPHNVVRRLGLGICPSTSHSHSHTLPLTCTCCYDVINENQLSTSLACLKLQSIQSHLMRVSSVLCPGCVEDD